MVILSSSLRVSKTSPLKIEFQASQIEASGPNVDAMAQASAFILQLQQELDSTKHKLEEQVDRHLSTTVFVC